MKSHEMLAAKASTVLVSQAPKSRSVELIRWFARSVTILSQFVTIYQRKLPYLTKTIQNENLVTGLVYKRLSVEQWCPGADLNHRHEDFQSTALPLSYPGVQTQSLWLNSSIA